MKFFLSHAALHNAEARALADGLDRAGLPIWCCTQPDAMALGQPFTGVLERELVESRGCIVLVGKDGIHNWVRAEVDYVLNRQVRNPEYLVIPLLLPDTGFADLPPFLARLQSRHLVKPPRELGAAEFKSLVEAIQASMLGKFAPETLDTCPFPGLEAFTEEQARFFFGRDLDVRRLCAKLAERVDGKRPRWLQLHGASGVGKSSLLRAGLVPAVRRGWLDDVAREWIVATTRPGRDPIVNLAEAVAKALTLCGHATTTSDAVKKFELGGRELSLFLRDHLDQNDGFLLVIDQFEEMFTLGSAEDPRRATYEELIEGLLDDGDRNYCVVTTTRSDFVEDVRTLGRLGTKLREHGVAYVLGSMDEGALRDAVTGPTRLCGIEWERGLEARLLQDVLQTEGGLPLLGHVLHALWEERGGNLLTHDVYQVLGELGGALSSGADSVLKRLPELDRPRAINLFLQLVKTGRGTRDARRSLPYEEALEALGGGEDARRILVDLSGGEASASVRFLRLVVLSGEDERDRRVDLVHEALIRKWKTLSDVIERRREELEKRDDLELLGRRWELRSRAEGFLLSEETLVYWEAVSNTGALAREFVEASRRRVESLRHLRKEATRRQAKRGRVVRTVAFVGMMVVIALALIVWRQRTEHRVRITQQAIERAASAQLLVVDPRHSIDALKFATLSEGELLLSGHERPSIVHVALDAALDSVRHSLPLRGHSGLLTCARFSPDGLRIVTGSQDSTARIWNANDGRLVATLAGHDSYVSHPAFSPDGRRIITGSLDGTARVWNTDDGSLVATLIGHEHFVVYAEFSPDNRRTVTASYDGTARVWNADDWKLVATLAGHQDIVVHAEFSPDGGRIATASKDGTARVWVTDDGSLIATLIGHGEAVWDVEFSADGQWIVTAGGDKTARIWSAVDGSLVATLSGHEGSVWHAEFSPDCRRIVTSSSDRTPRIWNAENGSLVAILMGHESIAVQAKFSPDGQRIVTASSDKKACVWNADDGRLVATLTGHESGVVHAEFSPDGRQILTASGDTARVWNSDDGCLVRTLTGHEGSVRYAEFSSDGRRVVTASDDKAARVWNADDGTLIATLTGHGGPVGHAELSPDGRRILTASWDKTARVWSANDGRLVATLIGHEGVVRHAEFSPDGSRIVTASNDQTARLWTAHDGNLVATLIGHNGPVRHAAYSPVDPRVVTAGEDKIARVWSADDGSLITTLTGHGGVVRHAAFSPDGRRIVTSSLDKTARVWNADDGGLVATLTGHGGAMWHAEFSPDGRRIVTVNSDNQRVWNADDGTLVVTLTGHRGVGWHAEFSPDGRRIVTASDEKTARVWNADDGTLVATLTGHGGPVWHAEFSSDGRQIVTASDDGIVRIFTLDERELMKRACRLLRNQAEWQELGPRYEQFLNYEAR